MRLTQRLEERARALTGRSGSLRVTIVASRVSTSSTTESQPTTLGMVAALRAAGHDVSVVTPEPEGPLADKPSLLVHPAWEKGHSAQTDASLAELLPGLAADVVVTTTPGLLAAVVQLLADGVALVHHESRSPAAVAADPGALSTSGPLADAIVVPIESSADAVRELLGDRAPVVEVVPAAVATDVARSSLDVPVILGVGTVSAEANFAGLVNAFANIADELPGWRLRLVGKSPMVFEMKVLARKRGVLDRVDLPGAVDDEAAEWAGASIAALTSRTDASSALVPMAAGVPVVALDGPSGARQVVTSEADGLLVGPGSVQGLATALLRLATDPGLRQRLGAAALETARRHSPEAVATRWADVLDAAADRRSATPNRVLRASRYAGRSQARVQLLDERSRSDLTPADARRLALEWAVRCADRTTDRWLARPPHSTYTPTVIVPWADRQRFLDALASATPEPLTAVEVDGARTLLTPRASSGPFPGLLDDRCAVAIEFWETAPDGALVAPGNDAFLTSVPPNAVYVTAEVEGVSVRTIPLLTEPTVDDVTFPVDVVYTWVDGSDDAWNEARERRLAELGGGTAARRESSGRARYMSHDELRHSLRSVHLFAPWVRHIYLVTAGQRPAWLADHPTVTVVDHAEILPADALPTFNSHAIESGLHRISGLAEHFVYLNDDFLLGRPLLPQHFFTPAGQPRVFMSELSLGIEEAGAPPWRQAAWHNRHLLRETFGVTITQSLTHAPYAHRVSVLKEIEERFADDVHATSRSPFRDDANVSMLSSLAQHYGLITGAAAMGVVQTGYVDISGSDLRRKLKQMRARDRDFICLADHHDHALEPERLDRLLSEFFADYLPLPAPWEDDA